MFEFITGGFSLQLVRGIRSMVQRRELFSDLLRIADHMNAFISHRMGGEEELRSRLEQSKANLAAAQKPPRKMLRP